MKSSILKQKEYRLLTSETSYSFLTFPNCSSLSDICKLYNGIKTGNNKKFISASKENIKYKPIVRGRDFNRYSDIDQQYFVLFDKSKLWSNSNEDKLSIKPKILIRQTGDRITATIENDGLYPMDTIHMLFDFKVNLLYLLGIINSKLFNYMHKTLVPETGKAFAEVKIVNLKQLSIPKLDLNNPNDKQKHDKLISLVDNMIQLHKTLKSIINENDANRIKVVISSTDREIDSIVYQLYNLSKDEIKIVEGGE